MKYINNYSKDWYKYLKKGDIVESIKITGDNYRHRPIGSHLEIYRDFYTHISYYSKSNGIECNSSQFDDFIPVEMQHFNSNEADYGIY